MTPLLMALATLFLPVTAPADGCTPGNPLADPAFASAWFAGKAEISRFELQQSRYGETHPGHAVLIFVTEDFLPEQQVKADDNDRQRSGAWPVLKLNFSKKFNTGVYPYSLMTSVFTPIETGQHPRTLKTTTSVQEWCGHTFLQCNLTADGYRARGFSYFQSESDQDLSLPLAWLEDEIWTRIRLCPEGLPTGRVAMIPGGQHLRLRHEPLAVRSAEVSLEEAGVGLRTCRVDYPEDQRSLAITFQAAAPYRIESWQERQGESLTTGRRTHTLWLAYWSRNHRADLPLREELGLPK